MNGSTSGPSRSRTSSNVETNADSRQVLLPTQGQSIFILNPIVMPSSSCNNMSNNIVGGTPNNGLLPLHSLPLQMMNSSYSMGNAGTSNAAQSSTTQNGNQYASCSNAYSTAINPSQEFLSSTTRKEEPVDLEGTEIPLSFMQAYNYGAMAQNSLQTGCIQLHLQIKEMNKEKAIMNLEIDRLNDKRSQLEKERDDLENLLAEERKETLKNQEELLDCKVKLDEMKEEAKLQEGYLQKEKNDGSAKESKIEELEKTKAEIESKLKEADRELQEAKDMIQKIVDEYFESITKPTTLNKLLREQLAKNPIESSSLYQISAFLSKNWFELYQFQEKNSMIPGTSTSKGTVASKSKKRKHAKNSFDADMRAGEK